MEIQLTHYVLTIGLLVLAIAKNSLSYNPIRFHCDNYILNTYLYFLLSWAIMISTTKYLEDKGMKLHQLFSGPFTILLVLSSLGLIIGLLFVPPQMFFTKHLLYLMWIVFSGIILYPMYVNNKSLFAHAGITTACLLLILSIISFLKPNLISDSWGTYLFMSLLGLLIGRVVEMFSGIKHDSTYSRVLSYLSILVFSMYVMLDTQNIIANAENCVNPDYINESVNLVLDSMNLFTNIYAVNSD